MLLPLGLLVAGALVVAALMTRRHGMGTGSALTFRGRLRLGDGPRRRGRLRVSPERATWRSLPHAAVDLTGTAVVSTAATDARVRRGDVELHLRLTDGTEGRLELPEAEAAATVRLRCGRYPEGFDPQRIRRSGPIWWANACLVVAALWLALMASMGFDGYTAAATVVHSDGSWTCTVTWQDPRGSTQRDDTDCFGEPAGSTLQILVPWGDFRGSVTTRPTLAFVGAVGAAPFLAVGTVRLWVVRTRRRTNAALLRLVADDLGATGREPASRADRTASALLHARRAAWAVAALGAALVAAVVALGAVMDEADSQLHANGVTTVGTVVDLHPDHKWQAGGADVRFTAGGTTDTHYVSLGTYVDDYATGQQVDVLYDPLAPDRFTIDDISYEPPWTTWPMIAALVGALFVGPAGVWRLRARRATTQVLATGPWTPVRVRVLVEEKTCWFTTADGTQWRSSFLSHWPTPGYPDDERREVGLPDLDPFEVPVMADAWWVRDGERAVFSPDQGSPLVLARMR